jgi:CBS domain-containing protein
MDVVQIFFPDFVSLLPNIEFVKDFGVRKKPSTGSLEMAEILLVRDIMEKPVAVEEDSGLLMALSVMYKHNLSDIPVLKAGKLVGFASRMDIGQAFLMDWKCCFETPVHQSRINRIA